MIERPALFEGFSKTCSDSLLSSCSPLLLGALSLLRDLGDNVSRKVIRLRRATELIHLGGGIGWSGEVRMRSNNCKYFTHTEFLPPALTGNM